MLTEKEQIGIKAILNILKSEDLNSLTSTVTNGLIKPETTQEAIQAILLYCEKPLLLLRRKKVKKEIIFHYLRNNGITVSVSGEKSDYIRTCLKFWGSTIENDQDDLLDDVPEVSTKSYKENGPANKSAHEPPTINPYATYSSLDPSNVVAFGQSFVKWFFGLLNQISLSGNLGSFGEQSFTQDCSFTWMVKDMEQIFSGNVQTPTVAMQVITEMIFTNRLTFLPGQEGVLSRYDPHGIMEVHAQGVVHQMNNCVGLFEQTFALFRDPSQENSWRIKKTQVKMQVNVSLSRPLPLEYRKM